MDLGTCHCRNTRAVHNVGRWATHRRCNLMAVTAATYACAVRLVEMWYLPEPGQPMLAFARM